MSVNKPTLVIMAAGMGSRFGGDKQIAPVDEAGHIIIDFSIYDALRAGFGKVVCVIKPQMEADFRRAIGDDIARHVALKYAWQVLDAMPAGFAVPEGRQKPWGTGHAVLCALDEIDGPFAVINADDFYGRDAFRAAAEFLLADGDADEHAMVGYSIENTLTENGSVSRGVCAGDAEGFLTDITERTRIEPREGGAAFTEDGGASWTFIPAGTPVSMNLWAFRRGVLEAFPRMFEDFLKNDVPANPLKAEFYLPNVPKALIASGKGRVRLLTTGERWYGMTYREDADKVKAAIAGMKARGIYPEKLWG
ncbi:MAG: NTP transferase domain-containing protein [Clostridia bacterium]|nr:NTP transferase domain-containing protein [Clostridia bacterium]